MAITSQATVDGALIGDCRPHGHVTCKTHWPLMNDTAKYENPLQPQNHPRNEYSSELVVLIRNPVHAIPSYYNQIFEIKSQSKFHSKQAPMKYWKKFMTMPNNILFRMVDWIQFIRYWIDESFREGSYYDVAHFVPYEQVVDVSQGPGLMESMATTLSGQGAPVVQNASDITCLWTYIVQERKRMKRSTDADASRYRPPYLARHQHMFVGLLTSFIHELEEKYPPSIISSEKKHHHYHLLLTTELIPILKGYRDDIAADFEILQE